MYPAQDFADGFYNSADLPDAISLIGVGSLAKSGTNYGNTTNGVILESGVWARYLAGVRTTKACLIDDDGNLTPGDNLVEDQFAATYTDGINTLTRLSLCLWKWDNSITGETIREKILYYAESELDLTNTFWLVDIDVDLDGLALITTYYKDGDQNQPDGTYIDYDGLAPNVSITP